VRRPLINYPLKACHAAAAHLCKLCRVIVSSRASAFSALLKQTIKVPQIDFGRGGPFANCSLLIQTFEIWLHAELQKWGRLNFSGAQTPTDEISGWSIVIQHFIFVLSFFDILSNSAIFLNIFSSKFNDIKLLKIFT